VNVALVASTMHVALVLLFARTTVGLLLGTPGSQSVSALRSSLRRSETLVRLCTGVSLFNYDDSDEECRVVMPIDESVRSRDIEFDLRGSTLTLGIKGSTPIINEERLWGRVQPDECFWQIDDVDKRGRCVVLELVKRDVGIWSHLLKSQYKPPDTTISTRVFMDVAIDNKPTGRVEIGLYGKQVPRTVENFRALCSGEKGEGSSGKPLCLSGSKFHRIIPGFMVQGGDFTNGDGTGGESIYGSTFEDEDFSINHDRAGILSMANSGPDSNGSQFFITLEPTPWLDGKHCVFGEVVAGMDVVRALEKIGDDDGTPAKQAIISACGEL